MERLFSLEDGEDHKNWQEEGLRPILCDVALYSPTGYKPGAIQTKPTCVG
jgi:hypothetical protein